MKVTHEIRTEGETIEFEIEAGALPMMVLHDAAQTIKGDVIDGVRKGETAASAFEGAAQAEMKAASRAGFNLTIRRTN